jgi:hypothetical protein
MRDYFNLCVESSSGFPVFVDLIEAIFAAGWSRSVNRSQIAALATDVYSAQATYVNDVLSKSDGADTDTQSAFHFVKRCLAAFLVATGCTIDTLLSHDFVPPEDVALAGSR